jgi:ABC-type methionine transport system permease subunit
MPLSDNQECLFSVDIGDSTCNFLCLMISSVEPKTLWRNYYIYRLLEWFVIIIQSMEYSVLCMLMRAQSRHVKP